MNNSINNFLISPEAQIFIVLSIITTGEVLVSLTLSNVSTDLEDMV